MKKIRNEMIMVYQRVLVVYMKVHSILSQSMFIVFYSQTLTFSINEKYMETVKTMMESKEVKKSPVKVCDI